MALRLPVPIRMGNGTRYSQGETEAVVTFFVSGKPTGKQSVRVYKGRAFIPAKTRKYMNRVASAFQLSGSRMIAGAVTLDITEYRPRPLYHMGTGRKELYC